MSGLFGDCPTWLDSVAWAAYCEWRQGLPKKQRMTPYARNLILAELAKLHSAGEDPTACLNQSMRNSWLDVYAVRKPKPAPFTALPANDAKPAPQVASTAAYIAELDAHKAAAQSPEAAAAREKLRELRDKIKRVA